MSIFRVCDGDDCNNNENCNENCNDGLFHVADNAKEFLIECYPEFKTLNELSDLCLNCIEIINEEFNEEMPLVIVCDSTSNLIINKSFENDPELVRKIFN